MWFTDEGLVGFGVKGLGGLLGSGGFVGLEFRVLALGLGVWG